MYIEGIYLNTEVDSTFDNMMSSVADYTGSIKTDSAKEFLRTLAAALERSSVVIAIGPLSGKNGLINVMSKGLSLPMTEVDWAAMGVTPVADTLMPKGAVPLLNGEDIPVGMILESGNQSIIVLSDDENTRAEMLQSYIEPYIGAKSVEATIDEATDIPANDGAEYYDEPYDNDYETDQAYYGENGADGEFFGDENDANAILDELFDNKADGNHIGFIEEEDFVLEDEPKKVKKPKKNRKKFVLPLIGVLLIVALVCGYFGYNHYYMPKKCRDDYETLRSYKELGGNDSVTGVTQYGKLYDKNNDMFGWISIDGTEIDYPVVSSSKKGEKYYRNHTFSGVYGSYGTPYITFKYDSEGHNIYPPNTVIFGNNTEDGQMFSSLEKYLDLDYYKAHPVITMNSIHFDDSWKIIGIMPMSASKTTAAVDYTNTYSDDTEMPVSYLNSIKTYSVINCVDTASPDDHLLTLVVPYSKDKDVNIVITARRVEEGEDPSDTSSASYNESAKNSNVLNSK